MVVVIFMALLLVNVGIVLGISKSPSGKILSCVADSRFAIVLFFFFFGEIKDLESSGLIGNICDIFGSKRQRAGMALLDPLG